MVKCNTSRPSFSTGLPVAATGTVVTSAARQDYFCHLPYIVRQQIADLLFPLCRHGTPEETFRKHKSCSQLSSNEGPYDFEGPYDMAVAIVLAIPCMSYCVDHRITEAMRSVRINMLTAVQGFGFCNLWTRVLCTHNFSSDRPAWWHKECKEHVEDCEGCRSDVMEASQQLFHLLSELRWTCRKINMSRAFATTMVGQLQLEGRRETTILAKGAVAQDLLEAVSDLTTPVISREGSLFNIVNTETCWTWREANIDEDATEFEKRLVKFVEGVQLRVREIERRNKGEVASRTKTAGQYKNRAML